MATRKKFVDVEIPLLGDTVSLLGTPETLAGRTIKIDFSRKLRGKSLEGIFKIYNGETIYALPKSLNLMKFYIRRMIRKRSSYIEDSFKANCQDASITIKPFLITRKRVSRAIRNNLRRTSRDFLINYIKDKSYFDLCQEIVASQIQREMLPKLKKIYPLSFCEIRVFETKDLDSIKYIPSPKSAKSDSQEEDTSKKPIGVLDEEKTQAEEIDEANAKKKAEAKEEKTQAEEFDEKLAEEKPKKEKKAKKEKAEAKE